MICFYKLYDSFISCQLQGNYTDAIACYNEVLNIDPLAADGLVNRGNTFKEIGRMADAIQDYVRAVNIRPTMAEAHANLASAYKDRYHNMSLISIVLRFSKKTPLAVFTCL